MTLLAYAGKLRLAASKLVCYLASVACGDGTCCGGEWHANEEDGECCNGQWLSDELCPEGQVYRRWGPEDACCGCLDAMIFDPRVGDLVPVDDVLDVLCCGGSEYAEMPFNEAGGFRGCTSGCCQDGVCSDVPAGDCTGDGGELLGTPCAVGDGCPVDCCYEDADGIVQCGPIGQAACVAPRVPADPDCASGCLGQCCVEGEPQGMMTQGDCSAMNGQWQGLGVEECSPCSCRQPFDCDCCESKWSTAAGLTFNQPRNKRKTPWHGTFRVVATGHTDSPILIHGEEVGANCDFHVEFLLCWESFNVEPYPCGTNFKKLYINVCWFEELNITETLPFAGCNTGLSIHLGDCEENCVTTLVYSQEVARSSDANIYTRHDAELYVESGEIEFTGDITAAASDIDGVPCSDELRVLKLTGGIGKISGVIKDLEGSGRVEVHKDLHIASPNNVIGGEWWLSGANEFTGRLRVHSGTVVIGADVASGGASPMGQGASTSLLPLIGDTLLLADGVDVARSLTIADDGAGGVTPVLGGYGTGSSSFTSAANIQLHADTEITLIARTGGTVTFANSWTQHGSAITLIAAERMTVGSTGNAGTVVINNTLDAVEIALVAGTLRYGGSEIIYDPTRPVSIGSGLGSVTFDLDTFSQTLEDLTFTGDPATITGGTLVLGSTNAAAVTVSGVDHEIASDVTLGNAAAFTVNASSDLTISGVISGANPITLDGTGTLTLSASNTYSGTTTIDGGTAVAGNANAFGTGGITVNAGGTLNTNGYTLPNTITNNGGTVI